MAEVVLNERDGGAAAVGCSWQGEEAANMDGATLKLAYEIAKSRGMEAFMDRLLGEVSYLTKQRVKEWLLAAQVTFAEAALLSKAEAIDDDFIVNAGMGGEWFTGTRRIRDAIWDALGD